MSPVYPHPIHFASTNLIFINCIYCPSFSLAHHCSWIEAQDLNTYWYTPNNWPLVFSLDLRTISHLTLHTLALKELMLSLNFKTLHMFFLLLDLVFPILADFHSCLKAQPLGSFLGLLSLDEMLLQCVFIITSVSVIPAPSYSYILSYPHYHLAVKCIIVCNVNILS